MKRKTGIFVHAVVHKFTVRSVACIKLHCQEGYVSDVKGNNIGQRHNKVMKNRLSTWQMKLLLSNFKLFVLAN